MGVQFAATELTHMSEGMSLEEAREVMDEALAEGKIRTKSGRVVSDDMGFYALRLFATGSESHQFAGVRAGANEEEDRRIRTAAWVLYRNTQPPDSYTKRENNDTANRKTRVSRGSQSMTVSFRMPDSLNRADAMEAAGQAVDAWIKDFDSKKQASAKDTALKAVKTLKGLGLSAEDLATSLGISLEAANALMHLDEVQEATEPPVAQEENGEENGEDDNGEDQDNGNDGEDNGDEDEDKGRRAGRRGGRR